MCIHDSLADAQVYAKLMKTMTAFAAYSSFFSRELATFRENPIAESDASRAAHRWTVLQKFEINFNHNTNVSGRSRCGCVLWPLCGVECESELKQLRCVSPVLLSLGWYTSRSSWLYTRSLFRDTTCNPPTSGYTNASSTSTPSRTTRGRRTLHCSRSLRACIRRRCGCRAAANTKIVKSCRHWPAHGLHMHV